MLLKRLIPCLDVKAGRVVKGVEFLNLKDAGDPVELAKFYNQAQADELCFLDITASHEKRGTLLKIVKEVASQIFIPFTVGGGVRTLKDAQKILRAGADKICVNSAAVKNPQLLTQIAAKLGQPNLVLAIDARATIPQKKWEVVIHGGRILTNIDVIAWAQKGVELGAGEILLTSMDQDGTKRGFDLALTAAVSRAVKVPVIASGGAGKLTDFAEVFTKTQAAAALAASLFHFRQTSILATKKFLTKQNIPVRI